LLASKNKDLVELPDIPALFIEFNEQTAGINEKFKLDIQVNSINNCPQNCVSQISQAKRTERPQ